MVKFSLGCVLAYISDKAQAAKRLRRLAILALGAAAVLMFPRALFAQGCATCYTTAAAAKDVAIRALRHGILILAVPPVVIFCAIIGMAMRGKEKLD